MTDFSLLFQKLLKNIPTETLIRDFLLKYLKNNFNIIINRKHIQVQKNNIIFNISPIIKSKLFPYSEQILEDLNNYLKENNIQMIIKNII
jgi:hypothetical protein